MYSQFLIQQIVGPSEIQSNKVENIPTLTPILECVRELHVFN